MRDHWRTDSFGVDAEDAEYETLRGPISPGKRTLTMSLARGIQRKAAPAMPAARPPAVTSTGRALPEDVRAKMEQAFCTDFSNVRVHEGPHVEAAGAVAYATGSEVHFAPGRYQPGDQRGQELLGHELAHLVQQSQGRVRASTQAAGLAVNDDPALEREADEMGARAARGERAGNAPAGAIGATGPAQRRVAQLTPAEDARAVEPHLDALIVAIRHCRDDDALQRAATALLTISRGDPHQLVSVAIGDAEYPVHRGAAPYLYQLASERASRLDAMSDALTQDHGGARGALAGPEPSTTDESAGAEGGGGTSMSGAIQSADPIAQQTFGSPWGNLKLELFPRMDVPDPRRPHDPEHRGSLTVTGDSITGAYQHRSELLSFLTADVIPNFYGELRLGRSGVRGGLQFRSDTMHAGPIEFRLGLTLIQARFEERAGISREWGVQMLSPWADARLVIRDVAMFPLDARLKLTLQPNWTYIAAQAGVRVGVPVTAEASAAASAGAVVESAALATAGAESAVAAEAGAAAEMGALAGAGEAATAATAGAEGAAATAAAETTAAATAAETAAAATAAETTAAATAAETAAAATAAEAAAAGAGAVSVGTLVAGLATAALIAAALTVVTIHVVDRLRSGRGRREDAYGVAEDSPTSSPGDQAELTRLGRNISQRVWGFCLGYTAALRGTRRLSGPGIDEGYRAGVAQVSHLRDQGYSLSDIRASALSADHLPTAVRDYHQESFSIAALELADQFAAAHRDDVTRAWARDHVLRCVAGAPAFVIARRPRT